MGTVVTWQQGIEENGHLKAFLPHYQMFLGLCVDDKWSSPHYQMFLRLCVDDKWSSSGATNVGGYVENKVGRQQGWSTEHDKGGEREVWGRGK